MRQMRDALLVARDPRDLRGGALSGVRLHWRIALQEEAHLPRDARGFLSYLEQNRHARVKRYPIVARWRDDVFFVQASVYPFQPWGISGEASPPANPLAISQPCVRFLDIDNVGKTGQHFTMFEMMAHHAFNFPKK